MNYNIQYKIYVEKFITVLFFILVIFYGKIPFQSYNSPFWKVQVIFYLVVPSLLYIFIVKASEKKYFIFKTNYQNIILGFSFLIISIICYLNDPYLKYDELVFARSSFTLVEKVIDVFNIFFGNTTLSSIKSKHLFQLTSLMFWIFLLVSVLILNKVKNRNKRLLIMFFLLLILRTLTLLTGFQIDVHPPLNYFLPNVLCTIFGINDLTFKLGSHLAFSIAFFHILNRIKLNFKRKLIFCFCILTIPQIGYSSFLFEQGNYFYLFSTIVLFEISFIKPKPFILSLTIAIAILFRYTNIILLIPYIFYTYNYYKGNYSFKKTSQKMLYDSVYLLISLPAFYQILFLGTTSTETINFYFQLSDIADKLLNIELLIFSAVSYNYYTFLILISFVFIVFKRDFSIFFSLITISISYLILKNSAIQSDFTSNFDSRYQFELLGFIIFFSILYLSINIKNTRFQYSLLFTLIIISFYQPYNNLKYQSIPTYFLKNNSYLFDYLKSNQILDKTIIYTYPNDTSFELLLHGFKHKEIIDYKLNYSLYMNTKKTNWLNLDIQAIDAISKVDYLCIMPFYPRNKLKLKDQLDSLSDFYNWKKVMNLPNLDYHEGFSLLKRNN